MYLYINTHVHVRAHSEAAQATVIVIEAKFVSKQGVEDRTGAVTLKHAPRQRAVVTDHSTLQELLSRIERVKP